MSNASIYFQTVSLAQFVTVQALCIPIGAFAMFGNAIVLAAYIKYKAMRKVECAHLITTLSACDFLNGFGSIVLGLSRLRIPVFNYYDYTRLYCITTSIPWLTSMEMGQVITFAIALDRLMAMTWPYMYPTKNHRFYAIGVVVAALLVGVGFLLLSTVGINLQDQPNRCTWISSVTPLSGDIFLISNAIIGPLVGALYAIALYNKARWTNSQIHSVEVHHLSHVLQVKVTKLVTKIIFVYIILLGIPMLIYYISIKLTSPLITSLYVSPVVSICLSLNSCTNFFLYALSSSSIQPFIANILTCRKREH